MTAVDTSSAVPAARRRRLLFLLLGAVIVATASAYGLWWLLIGSHSVTTDNAYVGADTAQITPLVAAAVREVRVRETQSVRRGDVLVVLDDTDARVEVDQATAQLAQAERQVRGYFDTNDSLSAQGRARRSDVAHAQAQLSQAQASLDKANIDLARRKKLLSGGSVSGDEVTAATAAQAVAATNVESARASLDQARANDVAARAQLAAGRTLTDGTRVSDNPAVLAALAKLHQAQLDLQRTVIRAPIDGIVAKRQVQVGQRVAIGAALMSVVPVTQAYVDANFKEGQLRNLRIGQPATLTADIYGGAIVYHGRVVGRGGGTGSAFAIIPAQNATGNWIKVVQRVPVRIALDGGELERHPLLVGLSMNATIDTASGR